MTLVCAVAKPVPVLLGDLVLTTPKRSGAFRGPIPTVGAALGPHGKVRGKALLHDGQYNTMYLAGLAQKLCLLSPRLALGWSGHRIAAETVLSAIREEFGTDGVTFEEMSRFLAHIGYSYRDAKIGGLDLTLVGLSLDSRDGCYVYVFGNGVIQADRYFDTIRSAGYGTPHFLRTLEHIDSSLANMTTGSLYHDSICRLLFYSAIGLVQELLSGHTLHGFFGGGFEIVLPLGEARSLCKFGEVTYIFWFIDECDGRKIRFSAPPLFLKLSYVDDLLIIRRLALSTRFRPLKSGLQASHQTQYNVYVVPSLFTDVTKSKKTLRIANYYQLQAAIMCTCFVYTRTGAIRVLIEKDRDSIVIEEGGDATKFHDFKMNEVYGEQLFTPTEK